MKPETFALSNESEYRDKKEKSMSKSNKVEMLEKGFNVQSIYRDEISLSDLDMMK